MDRMQAMGGALGHCRCPVHNSTSAISLEYMKLASLKLCLEAGVDVLFYQELLDVAVENGRVTQAVTYGKYTRTISVDTTIFASCRVMGPCIAIGEACGICGTDVHIFHGHQGAAETTPPTILGHELSGAVAAVGAVWLGQP